MAFNIRTEEAHGLTELQALLQQIITVEKLALRDIKVVHTPREGRYLVVWEEKI